MRKIIFLGTPHHGAPLERGGNWVDMVLAISPYTAPLTRLGKIRSAGITDLRHGSLLDEDWEGRDRFAHTHDTRKALPPGVACYAIAATTAKEGGAGSRLAGDGIVPVDSALGRHSRFDLAVPRVAAVGGSWHEPFRFAQPPCGVRQDQAVAGIVTSRPALG